MLWYNKGIEPQITIDGIKAVYCSENFKFHGRFAFALLAKTEYIAIFDDDTIPGKHWFENCLDCMQKQEGIYGTRGIILSKSSPIAVGWNGQQNNNITEVDLVGHAWFFKRDWLKYMWQEYPISWENGEDIQFSYLCQKYGNIKTFVPPHPKNDKSVWGSIKGENGNDIQASWRKNHHGVVRDQIEKSAISQGWQPINTRKNENI